MVQKSAQLEFRVQKVSSIIVRFDGGALRMMEACQNFGLHNKKANDATNDMINNVCSLSRM